MINRKWLISYGKSVLLIGLFSFISACTTFVEHTTHEPVQWQTYKAKQKKISAWNLTGRLGITSEEQSGTLDLFWKQTQDQYILRLIAPFGQGTILIRGNKNGVHVRTREGEHYSQNPDDFIASQLGVYLPVEHLRHWLLGIPADDAELVRPKWNLQGQLYRFTQDGWNIELTEYLNLSGYVLPHRFNINRDDREELNLKLIIKSWKLEQQ